MTESLITKNSSCVQTRLEKPICVVHSAGRKNQTAGLISSLLSYVLLPLPRGTQRGKGGELHCPNHRAIPPEQQVAW